MLKEFKEFAVKGNLADLAVAFVMGAAFLKLSTSFIEDLIMPLIGKIAGGADFSNRFIALSGAATATNLAEAKEQGAVFPYGNFITVGINFVIVAFVMFLVVKSINWAKALCENQQLRPLRLNRVRKRSCSGSCSAKSAVFSSKRVDSFQPTRPRYVARPSNV